MSIKIVAISDTHCQLDKIAPSLPEGDILLHAGDATYRGDGLQIGQFNQHLGLLKDKYKHILFTPGNHDFGFQESEKIARRLMTNATVLIDEAIELYGYKFYFSPWQPWFYNWAFNFPEWHLDLDNKTAKDTWAKIPNDTEILVTHCPPFKILDKTLEGRNIGCPFLRERILQLDNLIEHVFGHCHESAGTYKNGPPHGNTTFRNVAICNRQEYIPVQPWHTFELPDKNVVVNE